MPMSGREQLGHKSQRDGGTLIAGEEARRPARGHGRVLLMLGTTN
jgi:hypothetical protein